MRPVSDAFLRTVRGSHVMAARATVLTTFQSGTTPTGTEITVLDGLVTVDGSAQVRSSADLTTDGTGMWPAAADDLLAPYGNEVFIERGVQYGNGATEYCSLGYFRINAPEQQQPTDGPIRITLQDRMAGIIDARLTSPQQFLASATYGTVMTTLVQQVYPTATIEWDDSTSTETLGRALICEQDRFAFLDDLVTSVGKRWYWDYRGVLVIAAAPDPGTPVFDVNAGRGGVLVSARREITRIGVYNAVVAQGEAADTNAPVRGFAFDNGPSSPTYYSGRFGPVPQFYNSPFLTSDSQAQAAAEALLRRSLGLPYNVDFAAVPNPALEPGDPVRIRFRGTAGLEIHVLDQLDIPLTHKQAMNARTREQTTVLIGTS